jgi:carotenoid 1,2-hydratase
LPSILECARAKGGYAWWYVEAHDTVERRYGLALILFAGSVFSPYYADRLHRGEAAIGLEHPAVNLALYERPSAAALSMKQRLWVMNEYPPSALRLDCHRINVQRSFIAQAETGELHVELREEVTRFFARPGPRLSLKLRVSAPRFYEGATAEEPILLGQNAAGEQHLWQPLILAAEAEVELSCGSLNIRYRGVAYSDRNFGNGRLEDTFRRWSWAHGVAEQPGERRTALVLYQAQRREGGVTGLVLSYSPALSREGTQARATLHRCPEEAPFVRTASGARDFLWLPVPGEFCVGTAKSERQKDGRLEDAPFYARYVARLSDPRGSYLGVGEYLDLERFRSRAVQRLLTYKSRRVLS